MERSSQESHLRSENCVTYESPYPLYSMAISSSTQHHHPRIAIGSFIEELSNRVDIVSFDEDALAIRTHPSLSFDHPYPPTKLMFHPNSRTSPDHLASSGEYLRLWEVRDNSIQPLSVLNNSKTSEFCAPLTSFDWNEVEPRRIGTSSIDTTCTIWDVERGVVETQLIAHDKEVYDIAWGEAGVFASIGLEQAGCIGLVSMPFLGLPRVPVIFVQEGMIHRHSFGSCLRLLDPMESIQCQYTWLRLKLTSCSGLQLSQSGLPLPSPTNCSFLKFSLL
ncbi:unnamed protein product, partial [Vitis vinifera]